MRRSLVIALSLVFVGGAVPATAAEPRGVTVQAVGQIKVTPDAANVAFSISALRKSSAEALSAANALQAQARAALINGGAKKENITTTGLNISPEYSYTGQGEPTLIGYRATQNTNAAVYSIDKAGLIIDALSAISDDVRIVGISLFVADPAKYETKMRALAVAQARAKATAYARLLGRRLGAVQYLTETSAPAPTFKWESSVSGSADRTQIDPGQQVVSISIEVRWSLR